ncbi:hypothetical protein [Nocardia sp. bgisy134]|uniref:hypothetical protein n=1 Tax=Nocardia sp. bgisy134 TaxID=3413789 RepID=UPI003D71B058
MGFDEFLGVVSIEQLYSNLDDRARELFGPDATQHDLTTSVANRFGRKLKSLGFDVSVWTDGMLKSHVVQLDSDIEVHCWTHWSPGHARVRQFVDAGHRLVNFNDRQLYYALGNTLVYPYPTARSILESRWTPGEFSPMLPVSQPSPIPPALAGRQAIEGPPYPDYLEGAVFSIWCDNPTVQTEDEVFLGVKEPLAAFALRCKDPHYDGTVADVRTVAEHASAHLP